MFDLFIDDNKNNIINLIIKTAGNACNIDCKYCFEKTKNVAHNAITPYDLEFLINKVESKCSVLFHGGEPLIIGKKKFQQLLDIVKKYYPDKVIAIKIQTNGTLIDEEWINILFKKYESLNIEISISLDGTKYMNKLRVDSHGNNSFDIVKNAFYLLEKYSIRAGLLSVIAKHSLPYPKEYVLFLKSIKNLFFVKINPLFDVYNNNLTEDSITPLEYANFIKQVSDYYITEKLYNNFAIEPILSILQKLSNKESKYCNYSYRKCFNYISAYSDGKIGPCDCLSINEFPITSINDLNSDAMLEEKIKLSLKLNNPAKQALQKLIDECKYCDIKNFCCGGCISQRYYFRNNPNLLHEFCESKHYLYKYFSTLKNCD